MVQRLFELEIFREPSGDFLVCGDGVVPVERRRMEEAGLEMVMNLLGGGRHAARDDGAADREARVRVRVRAPRKGALELSLSSSLKRDWVVSPFATRGGAGAFFEKVEALFGGAALDPIFDRIAALPRLATSGHRVFTTRHFALRGSPERLYAKGARAPASLEDVLWTAMGPYPGDALFASSAAANGDVVSRFVDLTAIDDAFLPTSAVHRVGSAEAFASATPRWNDRPVTRFHRLLFRVHATPRQCVSAIIPPGVAHHDAYTSVAFEDDAALVLFAGIAGSSAVEALVRTSGPWSAWNASVEALPFVEAHGALGAAIRARVLCLSCVTSHYAALWHRVFDDAMRAEEWTSRDPRLPRFASLARAWSRASALRAPWARQQARVELDALVAILLGLSRDELGAIDAVICSDLREAERATFYDANGRIAHTTDPALLDLEGPWLGRAAFARAERALAKGAGLPLDAHDRGLRAPFDAPFGHDERLRAYDVLADRFGGRCTKLRA